MKRHPSLQPLSRDHHEGLLQARELRHAAERGTEDQRIARERFRELWDDWFRDHLALEERRLSPLIPEIGDVERLRAEHEAICSLADGLVSSTPRAEPDRDLMLRLAEKLHDHIRWEERRLFPAIEEAAGEEELRSLGEETRNVEAGRPRSRRPIP